jgi:hypothetical protein
LGLFKKIISVKQIAKGFLTARILLPSSLAKRLAGGIFYPPGMIFMVGNNSQISKLEIFRYSYCVFIYGEFRLGLAKILGSREISSVYWSYKDTLIIITTDKLVFRVSGPKSYTLNKNNYDNLLKFDNLDIFAFPRPISQEEVTDSIISCESFVGYSSFDHTLSTLEIFKGLFPLYQETVSNRRVEHHVSLLVRYYRRRVPIDWRLKFDLICGQVCLSSSPQSKYIASGAIHGDLTIRNLVIDVSKSISYFDLDRSEESFPEFDFFALFIDNEITSTGDQSYKRSLELAKGLGNSKHVHDSLELFYNILPEYSVNKQNFELICELFYVRTVAYIFSDAQFDSRIIIDEIFD